jgi:glycine/D-amino acid oxidase-like deaminating enzyme
VYPAGSHSTYQLTTGVFSNLLNQFSDRLTIDTSTPVHSIACFPGSPTEASPYCFTVATPRGDVRTRHVVHCTNSHAAHLIPGLRGRIFPAREHMTEHSFPVPERDDGLKRSWAFLWNKGFDYFIHRREGPSRDPAILLGGALAQSGDNGLDEFGVASDADEGIFISAYLRGLLPTIFAAQRHSDLRSSWTGILGWSADLLPWVGALPPSLTTRFPQWHGRAVDGCVEAWESVSGKEWIAAGYSGEGMTHAWKSGKAVAFEILGLDEKERVKHWLPAEYRVTEKRVEEADVRKLKELY